MQITDLTRIRQLSDPTLTPDGKQAAVAVTRIDLDEDDYRGDLWIVATDGSTPPRQLTHGPKDSQPRFSPDGKWLAFLRAAKDGKPQLHVLPTAGGEARSLTDHPLGVTAAAWAPDSRRLAYVAGVPEPGRYGTDENVTPANEPPRHITSRKYRTDDIGFTIDRRPHVFVLDLEHEGAPRQLTDGDVDDAVPVWSPDGRWIAFTSARHPGRHDDVITDVYVAAADGGEPRKVTDSTLTISQVEFVDAQRVVFLADSEPDVVGRNVRLWTADVSGDGRSRPLTERETWHLDSYGSGSRHPLLVADGTVTTLNQRRGAIEMVRVGLDGGKPEVLRGGQRQILGADHAAGVTAMIIGDATSAGELVVDDGGGERVLTEFGAELTKHADLHPLLELETAAPDGYPVHGWLVKPAGRGPFPVLLSIHGGPFAQYGWNLFDEAQIYAGAGYAVVLGNPRGASGYGEAHGRAIVGDMGNLDRTDLLTLLDHALAEPDLDGDRVGVMGGSYGGFMTTWLAGTQDRFRAAISERSVNVWDSFVGSSDIGWFFVDNYCGTDPERQRQQSPLTYADGIRSPMLIIHSEEDWRCPVEQAQRLFERLQRNGVESELLLFPGEGHELSRSGLPSHRVARFEAILQWWARHLGDHHSDGASENPSTGSSTGST
ncbi:MAG: prolyl oligopeptidase family serine peptidase [Nitriliruptorales bacterium]|nr:prolyl oligopeptidase family serine peptidase [Nitriliruptorales bacterium]